MVGSQKYYFVAVSFLLAVATANKEETKTDVFHGGISISCTNGTCVFDDKCINLDTVPGTKVSNNSQLVVEYTGISGQFSLEPASSVCGAECSNCVAIPGSDRSSIGNCTGSAGYVYCPETSSCIRPFETNCPFTGTIFKGPVDIICTADDGSNASSTGGRCNNLSAACKIAVGSFTIGGLYLDGLIGTYTLPKGCEATCQGCYSPSPGGENTNANGPTPTPSSSAGLENRRWVSSWKQVAHFVLPLMMMVSHAF